MDAAGRKARPDTLPPPQPPRSWDESSWLSSWSFPPWDSFLFRASSEGRALEDAVEASVRFDPEAYGDDGEVKDEHTAQFLRHYMEEYCAFVQRVLAANAPGHIGEEAADARKQPHGRPAPAA
jgi:hypothetical protein